MASDASNTALPPLTDHEFKMYNRLADRMEQFVSLQRATRVSDRQQLTCQKKKKHNYFRQSWNLLWTAASTSRRPQGMTIKQFLAEAISFTNHLTAHHGVEEAHVFPLLATRMPEFDPKNGSLVKQHEQIHEGLEEFQAYVKKCHAGKEDFEMSVLKEKMEGWGGILWEHLDEEVKMLGAERMRAVWSKEDMMRMPF